MMKLYIFGLLFLAAITVSAQALKNVRVVSVGAGWAKNSVNTVVFRKNSIVTYRDTQYVAYYNEDELIVLGKRTTGSEKWTLKTTPYKGDVTDAHKTISIIIDGDNYLHLAWGHHASPLNYAKSINPGSLELTPKLSMTGKKELKVTYTEFYKMPGGNLLFLYRDGSSGNGNLMLNRYDLKTRQWTQVQDGLIDGEGKRNAYWQMTVDRKATLHLSWVWRESSDVASNHDMCYARSTDGGNTWEKSTGEKYVLPITAASAEYAWTIPQKSSLINQTSTSVNAAGEPYIATYWKDAGADAIQYRLIYHADGKWNSVQVGHRSTAFTLGGSGTKKLPLSRPQIMVSGAGQHTKALMVFRDEERGNKPSIALSTDIAGGKWQIADLSEADLGSWEPSYDIQLWQNKGILNLFTQKTGQGDGETLENIPPQTVAVLEWKP